MFAAANKNQCLLFIGFFNFLRILLSKISTNGILILTLFFYKNNFYKNSEPQIWNFKIGFSENIPASCELIMKTNRGDQKKHFEHIIEGGQGWKFFKSGFKNKNNWASAKNKLVLIKKRVYSILPPELSASYS